MTKIGLRDAREILAYIEGLAPSFGARSWWTHYGFHFIELINIPSILASNALYSRTEARTLLVNHTEVGDPAILSLTDPSILEYVRLYWRPRTPMLYQTEGFKSEYPYGNSCSIPVYLLIPIADLVNTFLVEFTDRNAASGYHERGNSVEFVRGMPFEDVYHDRPLPSDRRMDIISRRQAEILVPKVLPLPASTLLIVRSPAEMRMLRDKLSPSLLARWTTRMRVDGSLFFKRWLFVDSVDRQSDKVSLLWNPDATLASTGALDLEFRFENLTSGAVSSHRQTWDGVSRIRFKSLGESKWRFTVFINQTMAFSGPI